MQLLVKMSLLLTLNSMPLQCKGKVWVSVHEFLTPVPDEERTHITSLDKRLGGPESHSGCCGRQKIFLSFIRIKTFPQSSWPRHYANWAIL